MVRTIKQWFGKLRVLQDERGLSLVESLIAVAIVGTTAVVFVVALSTGSIAVRENNQEVVAQSLARTQLEYTKGYPYDPIPASYPTVNATAGYAISVNVTATPDTDTDIQKITVTISREGEDILTVVDYKVNR